MAYLEQSSGCILSSAQAITTSAASTNIFDVTGFGSGVAPVMLGNQGLATNLGTDLGIGQNVAHPGVLFTVTTAGTGTGTIDFEIQAAPDNGSYSPGTYVALTRSAPVVGTSLTSGFTVYLPLPPIPSNFSGLPRFYQGYYTVSGTATVSVTAEFLMNPPSIKSVTDSVKNFSSSY
jgi:hypothetical protein